jgi:hypothetical protein
MMIFAMIVSTMITMAIVVFAIQYYSYRKNHAKREKACALKGSAGVTQEASAS